LTTTTTAIIDKEMEQEKRQKKREKTRPLRRRAPENQNSAGRSRGCVTELLGVEGG
jgi:hypothetical protein